jgi:hypothetical protein
MIIRMTVKDNDFSVLLEQFAENLVVNVYPKTPSKRPSMLEEIDIQNSTDWFETFYRLKKILNDDDNDILKNKDDYNFLANCIKKSFENFLNEKTKRTNDTKEYLLKNFEVKLQYQFKDKWENGEVVYYFTTNNKFISQ